MTEHIAGTTGGILGMIYGYVIGIVTLNSIFETVVYAFIGGTVGFLTMRLYTYIGKKIKEKYANKKRK